MSMPISDRFALLGLIFALGACGGGSDGSSAASSDEYGKAECAIGQGGKWDRACLVERGEGAAGPTLTLRHPDGGFRRFLIVTDGRGIAPADGAEQPGLSMHGDRQIEVRVGDDRYRLPATFAAPAR
ncbi:MAG: hypothetical protein AB7E60_08650 [Sphingobium sp.]